MNRDNRFNFIPLAEKPVVEISSSPENNSFPIGASINLTCKAEPRAEDESHLDRWVNYIRWYDPQGNEIGAKCQQPDREKRVKKYSCQSLLKKLTVDKFANYICQSGNDYPNHCTRKSFNVRIQGKQIRPHRAECLDIINYSSALRREILMLSGLEKPVIREEIAETSAAALINSLFQLPGAISERSKSGFLKRNG